MIRCLDSWHEAIARAPASIWRATMRTIEHRAILGTDQATEIGVCARCGQTLIRGRVPLAAAVLGEQTTRRAGRPPGVSMPRAGQTEDLWPPVAPAPGAAR